MPTDEDVLALVDAEMVKLQERLGELIHRRGVIIDLIEHKGEFKSEVLDTKKGKLKSDEPDLVPLIGET